MTSKCLTRQVPRLATVLCLISLSESTYLSMDMIKAFILEAARKSGKSPNAQLLCYTFTLNIKVFSRTIINVEFRLSWQYRDSEMHDDDLRNPRRIGSRVSFLAGKRKGQCVVLSKRRRLVLRLVALAMAFKNVRNLLLINHNDGFIDDDDLVVLYRRPLCIEKPRLSA